MEPKVDITNNDKKDQFQRLFDHSRVKGGTLLVFTHRQADPDALCAAYAISYAIIRSSDSTISAKIIAPKGANLLGSSVCKKLGIQFSDEISDEEISGANTIVAVDAGEPELLDPYTTQIFASSARKFLIDHHGSNKSGTDSSWRDFTTIIDGNSTSTCEIITTLLEDSYLDDKSAKALLVGLLFDSQHLGIATENTLVAALRLVRGGAKVDEAKDLLRSKPERSEIIARIKSAQRLKFESAGPYFIVQSEVSSFQAAVARMLIDIGADVGIAYGDHEGEVRISIRSTQQFFRETKIDLGHLLYSQASGSALTGGGHSTAASISGKGDAQELVASIIKRIKEGLPHS